MGILDWFITLDHRNIVSYVYVVMACLVALNFMARNSNINLLFIALLVIGVVDSITSFQLIEFFKNNPDLKGYSWLSYIYFSIFNCLHILATTKRKSFMSKRGYVHEYQLYLQEIGLITIAAFSIVFQFISMSNWLFYNFTGEYSMFIHGMYEFLKTVLLGLKNFILISLTLQNLVGLLKNNKKGVLSA